MELKNNPLFQQIKSNLNPSSVGSIIRGGPDRWRHVASQVATKIQPARMERSAHETQRRITGEIEDAGLKPITYYWRYEDTPIVSVGLEIPTGQNYELIIPPSLDKSCPELHPYIANGRYLLLAATTSNEPLYFNNGFVLIKDGEARQITADIQPFKGAIAISFRKADQGRGQLSLLSQDKTHTILEQPDERRRQFQNGGLLLGASLYTELLPQHKPTMADAI